MHKFCTLIVVLLLVSGCEGGSQAVRDALCSACESRPQGPAGQRFLENGDGTITDTKTGLMWEKKSDDESIHDKDNKYTWTAKEGGTEPDGTAFATFIRALNDTQFAGHSDWRLPTIHELETLRDLERSKPAMDPVFHNNCKEGCTVTQCSCTASYDYWSSTTYANNPGYAWGVFFDFGAVYYANKTNYYYVRAVRSGL